MFVFIVILFPTGNCKKLPEVKVISLQDVRLGFLVNSAE
jgi:hypothetical protein